MKYLLYSVVDKVTGRYSMPFYCVTHAEAVRSMVDFSRESRAIIDHARDSALVFLGEFDSFTGVVSGVDDVSGNVTEISDIFERYGVIGDKVPESV